VSNINVNTLYQLCEIVDGGKTSPPVGWQPVWANIPTTGNKSDDNFVAVFSLEIAGIKIVDLFDEPFTTLGPVYVVAIQGTNDFREILQDLEVRKQVPFEPISGAHISVGSSLALKHVLNLLDVNSDIALTLQSFLQSLPAKSVLLVTGHSLGGNIASVMTPWIASNIPQFAWTNAGDFPANLGAVTYAAPTAGDSVFATYLNAEKHYAAHFNLNDVVPHVWAQTGPLRMYNIANLFPNPGPTGAPCEVIKILFDFSSSFAETGISYTQTNGKMFAFPATLPDPTKSKEEQWLLEVDYQHNDAYAAYFAGPASAADTT
jgi:hypothetical protein